MVSAGSRGAGGGGPRVGWLADGAAMRPLQHPSPGPRHGGCSRHMWGEKVGCGRHGPPGPGLRLSPALGSHAARTALNTRVPHFSREEELVCVAVLGFGLALRLVGLGRRSFV